MGFFDDLGSSVSGFGNSVISPLSKLSGTGIGDLFGGFAGGLENPITSSYASAMQKAAEAQLASQQGIAQQALGYAAPTEDELSAMRMQLDLYTKTAQLNQEYLQQQTQLAAAINPNIIESARQASLLLQGGSAASTAPIMAQRQQQRMQLSNQLASQLGPGWQTSTAGIQAMNNFDNQTQQLQYGMMGSLLQYSGSFLPNLGGEIAQGASVQGNLLGGYLGEKGSIQGRQISALEQTNPTQYAGAPYAGQIIQGQAAMGLGNSLVNTAIGMGAGQMSQQMQGQNYQQYYSPTAQNPYSPGGSYMNGSQGFGGYGMTPGMVGGAPGGAGYVSPMGSFWNAAPALGSQYSGGGAYSLGAAP